MKKKTQARDLTLIGLVEGIPTDHCPAPQKKFTGPSKIYYSFNARSKIDVGEFPFLKPHVLLLSSSSFFPFHHKPFRQDKMADEVYDGAIGIDLGKSVTLDILFRLSSFCHVSIVCAVRALVLLDDALKMKALTIKRITSRHSKALSIKQPLTFHLLRYYLLLCCHLRG